MKLTEQEIQQLLEDGLKKPDSNDKDFNTYLALFDALKKEPKAGLPYYFPARITALIQVKHDLNIGFKFYLLTLLVVFIVLTCIYGILSVIPQQNALGILAMVLKYKGLLLFGTVVFLVVHYIDQRLKSNRVV